MREVIVDLWIPEDDYLDVYRGAAKSVSAISRDGRRVEFPVKILQPFVTREGVRGTFVIRFDDSNKFSSITKLG